MANKIQHIRETLNKFKGLDVEWARIYLDSIERSVESVDKIMNLIEIIPDDYEPQFNDVVEVEFSGFIGLVEGCSRTSKEIFKLGVEFNTFLDEICLNYESHKVIQLANGKIPIRESETLDK